MQLAMNQYQLVASFLLQPDNIAEGVWSSPCREGIQEYRSAKVLSNKNFKKRIINDGVAFSLSTVKRRSERLQNKQDLLSQEASIAAKPLIR